MQKELAPLIQDLACQTSAVMQMKLARDKALSGDMK